MPQEIEIGKQYRLNIVPNAEYRCPLCEYICCEELAEDSPLRRGIVMVTGKVPLGAVMYCGSPSSGVGCHKAYPAPEGLYDVVKGTWELSCPYTWLIPLEDADAEDAP